MAVIILQRISSTLSVYLPCLLAEAEFADEKTLCERLTMDVERGIRSEDIIERSIARIPMYQALNTIKIDTNAKTVAMIANEIKLL